MGASPSFPKTTFTKDHIALVTGGNTGIGYEIAKWIAALGAHVIIACRSEEKAKQAIAGMKLDFENMKRDGTNVLQEDRDISLEYMIMDCSSLKSTQNFIDTFKSAHDQLHILVCNAGIGMHKQQYTDDGNELMFQVNYLSHFLMTAKLLPVMMQSGNDCRIIMVSSSAHNMASFRVDAIQGTQFNEDAFDRFDYYAKSKLYQIMQMYSMNRRLVNTDVTVNCIHPGIVDSGFTRHFTDMGSWSCIFGCAKCCNISRTPYHGAVSAINGAVNPKLSGVRDQYYVDCKPKTPSSTSRNTAYQEQLWKFTLDCLKEYLNEQDIAIMEGKISKEESPTDHQAIVKGAIQKDEIPKDHQAEIVEEIPKETTPTDHQVKMEEAIEKDETPKDHQAKMEEEISIVETSTYHKAKEEGEIPKEETPTELAEVDEDMAKKQTSTDHQAEEKGEILKDETPTDHQTTPTELAEVDEDMAKKQTSTDHQNEDKGEILKDETPTDHQENMEEEIQKEETPKDHQAKEDKDFSKEERLTDHQAKEETDVQNEKTPTDIDHPSSEQ